MKGALQSNSTLTELNLGDNQSGHKHTIAIGHAVRAMYLYSAMADYDYYLKDKELLSALESLIDDVCEHKMCITGGIGESYAGERFSIAYDLDNARAYNETCASIGLAYFTDRLFKLTRKAKYGDIFEKALYNTILSGESLAGTEFFYNNPLEVEKDKTEPCVRII